MAESIGTTALFISADTQGLTSGLRTAKQQYQGFIGDTQRTSQELSNSFASVRDRAGGVFANLKAGDISEGFTGARDKIGEVFSNVKAGKFGEAFTGVKAALSDLLATAARPAAGVAEAVSGIGGSFASIVAPTVVAGAIIAGTIAGIGAAARIASKDVDSLRKLSERIGSSVPETGTILRAFSLGGIEDAEATLSKFFRKLGDVRADLEGPTANAFRQLRLNPEQLTRGTPLQALQQTVLALGQVSNVFDRANLAQEIFGRSYQELLELIRQGNATFAIAARQEARFGPGPETIAAAQRAEQEWRIVGRRVGEVWEAIKTGGRFVGTRLSEGFAHAARGVLDATDNAAKSLLQILGVIPPGATAPQQSPSQPRPEPGFSAGAVKAELGIREFQKRTELMLGLTDKARELGLVSENATHQEIEGVRDLIEWRERQLEDARRGNATEAELAELARVTAASAQIEANRRRNAAAEAQAQDAERALAQRRLVELEGLSAARARERISIENGINAAQAARIRAAEEENDALTRRRQILDEIATPLERFEKRRQEIDDFSQALLTRDQKDLAQAANFRRLEQSLGPGPSNFAVTAPDPRTLEGARFLADLQIRQRHGLDDPEQRVARVLEASRTIQQQQLDEARRIASALDNLPRTAPAPPI